MKKVIAVASIKGGVGKTTTVANLASSIARGGEKKVLVIDGNFSAPNLGIHFGYMNTPNTLQDVLAGNVKPHEAVYSYAENLHVLPGVLYGKYNSKWNLVNVVAKLKRLYDVIIIDTSPIVSELGKVIQVADEVVFVATPDYPSINTILQLSEYVKRKVPVRGVLLNMVKGRSWELSEKDVFDVSGLSVIGRVPYSNSVQRGVSKFKPVAFSSGWFNSMGRVYDRLTEDIF